MAGGGEALVHGTCVAFPGRAALLRGAPGTGKSDLALRFISRFGARGEDGGARLVADDQVLLARDGDAILTRPPEAIAGKLEVRGVGIVEVEYHACVPLALIVDMTSSGDVPRLPPDPRPTEVVLGVDVPVLRLDPFEASSTVKLKLALTGAP